MTLEQLISPKVTEWINNYNIRLNEGKHYSNEELFNDFDKWFIDNENEINESIKTQKMNESVYDELFDDDEEPVDEEPVDEEPHHTSHKKFFVDNSNNPRRNIFKVVNILYDKICNENKNIDKVTYFSFLNTADVIDMTALFAFTNLPNADLSSWDTSRVIHMEGMFYKSTFNNDSICDWNVSRCADFKNMFLGSKFSYSLSRWKPKMIKTTEREYDEETGEYLGVKEVEKRARLPFVGAYEDEEKEMEIAYWDDVFKDGIKENKKSKYSNFMDFETFMINEGIFDKTKNIIKKGYNAIKNLFKTTALKLNDWFIGFFDDNGNPLPVISPYTTLNYIKTGKVSGVKAYVPINNNMLNDIPTTAKTLENNGYYENISKDSNEYNNFKTFCEMLNESEYKGKFDELINEDRVGLTADSGGIHGIKDINSDTLKRVIKRQLIATPSKYGKNAMKPILIWGSPGIGKSTIPNVIISEYNKSKESLTGGKKALVIAECGDMTIDGFSLPMPKRMTFDEYISNRPMAQKWAKSIGLSKDELENTMVVKSDDVPKMWLPCYKPTTDKKINDLYKKIANGYVREYYDEDGNYQIEETCDGGLIMFDEFLRADPYVFKILMQILLNRRYGEHVIGDKWGIIACSNRPNDDNEVSQALQSAGAAVTTRFSEHYNFIPDFKDWQKWAKKEGHFDDVTISFLMSKVDKNGEFIYWHNIDPEKHTEGWVGHPTPRSWSSLMNTLYITCDTEGYSNILEIPEEQLMADVCGAIGTETGEKYIDYLKKNEHKIINVKKIFEDDKYSVDSLEEIPKAAEMSELILNYIKGMYSIDELPPEKYLINMYNFLDKTYDVSKDNYIKQLHINVLKYLSSPKLKKYFTLCRNRYNIDVQDLN